MKVGILGSGIVAQSLGAGFLKYNYETMLGTREKEKLKDWQSKHPAGKLGSFNEAAAFGDIIVLAVKGSAAKGVIESLKGILNGKTVIDATNPIADTAPENGVLKFFSDINMSLMEELQKTAPSVNFVKAFNSIGNAFMVNPSFEPKPTMFICGNNQNAKNQVTEIIKKFGFEAEDMGMAESARAIEPLCMLWCIPGLLRNEWQHAFRLLKK